MPGQIYLPDERVWLVPKTLGASTVCWKQPEATILGRGPEPETYRVRLVVGEAEHVVRAENLRRSPPQKAKDRPRRPRKVAAKELALGPGEEEIPLW